ncbi:hypothetical protein D3C80_1153160 [compost metagenome]
MQHVILHIKLQQTDVSQAPLRSPLIIGEHLIYFTIRNTVAIIIKLIDLQFGIMVMSGQSCNHIFVRFYYFFKNLISDWRTIVGHEQIFMQSKNSFAFRIFRDNLIHPFDLLISKSPAHIHDNEIIPAGRHQIIMSTVIFIRSGKGGHLLKALFTKIFPVFRIIIILVPYIVVTCQNTVWNICIFQHLHVPVGFLPLILLIRFVNKVTCMDDVLHIHVLSIINDPLYIFLVNVWEAL